MKAFYYNEKGYVIDIINLHPDATSERCFLSEDVPECIYKEGYSMRLVFKNGALSWEYVKHDNGETMNKIEEKKRTIYGGE